MRQSASIKWRQNDQLASKNQLAPKINGRYYTQLAPNAYLVTYVLRVFLQDDHAGIRKI